MTAPDAHPVSSSRVSLAEVMTSVDANLLGNVHGGEIMKLADSTAGAVAFRHAGRPAVTAAMDEMVFLEPVHVGDILRTFGQVNWVGRTSMEIGVRVETQPWGSAADVPLHVASAYFVFVVVDDGSDRPVPALLTEDDEDRRRLREAEIRRTHRLARRAAIEAGRS